MSDSRVFLMSDVPSAPASYFMVAFICLIEKRIALQALHLAAVSFERFLAES